MNTPLPTTGIAAQIAALFLGAQIVNNCTNGRTIAQAIIDYPSQGGAQWNAAYARNIALFVGGAPDLISIDSPETIFARVQAFWNLCIATGYTPIACTIIANGLLSPPQDGNRLIINSYTRATFPAAQVCDWASNVHYALATDANPATNPDYYSDVAHPTVFGAGVLAGIAQPLINNFLT